MATFKKYSQFLSRTVLLAAYVLLFATQGNCRFYDVANFFDYHHGSRFTAVAGQNGAVAAKADVLQSRVVNRNSAHLGMDKRFSAKHFYKLPDNIYSLVVSAETIEREYALLLKVYSTSDLPTNALRGPPIV
jgi:hypothetical protein